ncbi:MAG: GIY-YIG nuclease family protein [Alphaproteobacteria bacterium]|nr:GIY-YIG nuclease family protein [Alphaproteobacteria bacterium]
MFPELFKRLTQSPIIRQIDDEVGGKAGFRIHKQDWRPRAEFETELGARNVIYTLIDTKNSALYVGETEDLVKRFRQGHPVIKDWDYYRYDLLPPEAAPFRVALERMMIRSFATVLENSRNIPFKPIGTFRFRNERIDA